MSENGDERVKAMLREAADALVRVGGAGAGQSARASLSGSLATIAYAGVVVPVPATLGEIVRTAGSWRERELARWWHWVFFGVTHDTLAPEEIAKLIDEHVAEPFVHETVLRSVKALFDAIDAKIVVPLGVLARQYIREQRAPDYFFRSMCRLLSELSGREWDNVRAVAKVASECASESTGETILLKARAQIAPCEVTIDYETSGVKKARSAPGIPEAARILRTLVQCDLAADQGRVPNTPALEVVQMRNATARSLYDLIRLG